MGNSRPPAAVIDLVDSYARRRDGQVEIVLAGPDAAIGDNPFVIMRRDADKLKAPAKLLEDERGRRLVVTVPRGHKLRGTWRLSLVSDSEPRVRLQARLLVQGPKRPVVLLWGHRLDSSRLPDPHPREQGPGTAPSGPRAAAHKALSLLPEKRAEQVRHQVRKLRAKPSR